ncbi:MAG: hypothetical protein JHC84_11360 [Solirubrobacteraceae bacterium]|nr:hypothetical protein [Solirubrobacteraceae bacterium]
MPIQRLLVLAGEELANVDELPAGVSTLIHEAGEVFVLSPTKPGRLRWLFSDVDDARHVADERLSSVLGALRSAGVPAMGEVGADMPSVAIGDAIRRLHPDHILCAVGRARHRDWQLMERTERDYGVPMTLFELDPAHHPVAG